MKKNVRITWIFSLFLRRLRNGYNETLVTASMYNGFGFLVDLIGRFEGIFSISGDHLVNISVVIIGPFGFGGRRFEFDV